MGGTRWSKRARSKVWWGNMGYFENPIIIFGSVLCNILYCIVKLFSLIRVGRHVGMVGRTTLKPHVPYV